MKPALTDVPVFVTFFVRPEKFVQVLKAIRQARPSTLFLVADGPRDGYPDDHRLNEECKKIAGNIDWDCKVTRDYAVENYGLRKRVSSGLAQMFNGVDEAIILEDDCVPHQSFFPFCQELLERYRNEEKVMMISGNNFLGEFGQKEYSYHFSSFNHIWGWATWKRAWNLYDEQMNDWNDLKEGDFLINILQYDVSVKYYRTIFQEVYEDKINSWAYRWLYSMLRKDGLSIVPSKNLVTNLGFGNHATNTKGPGKRSLVYSSNEIVFPLIHPQNIERDEELDKILTMKRHRFSLRDKTIRFIKKVLRL